MFKTQETKVFGSIRKVKRYGACGVILGMAALAVAFSSGSVSADEVKPSSPATTQVAKLATEVVNKELKNQKLKQKKQ